MPTANVSELLRVLVPVLLAGYFIFNILRFAKREKHLPPGPPTWPVVGNAHLLAAGQVHIKYVAALQFDAGVRAEVSMQAERIGGTVWFCVFAQDWKEYYDRSQRSAGHF